MAHFVSKIFANSKNSFYLCQTFEGVLVYVGLEFIIFLCLLKIKTEIKI